MQTTILDSYRRHRFAWLFFSLLLTLTAHPALEAFVSGSLSLSKWMTDKVILRKLNRQDRNLNQTNMDLNPGILHCHRQC